VFGGVYLSGSLAEIPRRHFQGCEIQIRDGDWLMSNIVGTRQPVQDQPLLDTTPYGSGVDDSVTDTTENAAITQHTATINGTAIAYTAMAGHLVTTDVYSARPVAKIFYVSFTANGAAASTRPVTFFYNGGPGSSSVYLLLGSFGPRRIKTSMPDFTPPAPYALEDNPESLLDHTDLVFINPVGTGYSAAIAPGKNGDFWGVDEDARSIRQFVSVISRSSSVGTRRSSYSASPMEPRAPAC
jgi:carboxypeptidase C (cathepsin A)